MKKPRIAIGQISSESNHFTPGLIELDFFKTTGYLHEGADVFELAESDTEVGGFIAACRAAGVELVPLVAARANSGNPLSDRCYAYLRSRMLAHLIAAGPLDGVLISHHGSMMVENEFDPEGDLVAAIREIVGPDVAIGMTLDMHANVTPRRIENSNVMVGYEHYPHDDARRTGERAAALIIRTIAREIEPVMVHIRVPMPLSAFNASTSGSGPFAQLMNRAKSFETLPGILSTSLFLVGSYIDVPDMSCSTLVIADGDAQLAASYGEELAREFWHSRGEFDAGTMSVAEAIERGRQIAGGPVLLLDTADTTGGGVAGDGIGLVKGLHAANVTEPTLAMVIDPEVAAWCHAAPIGRELTVQIGHKIDPRWGSPLRFTATLVSRSDGRFRYGGGIFGGLWSSMGPSAVLRSGSIQLLVMSNPTYDWACEQYESVGLDPRVAKFVGVKNMMNFRRGYGDMMRGYFVLDLPGPTPTDYRKLPYKRVKRPIYPLDDWPDFPSPGVTQSARFKTGKLTHP